jgi:hypothetical protein
MFSIEFTDEPLEYPYDDVGVPAAPGRLVLQKSAEEFLANLSLWSKSDYEAQWARELRSLFDGNLKVALVVSYDDPRNSSNMEIWRVYRDGDWVHFQNQILPYSRIPNEFEILEISRYIDDRVTINSEGDAISEWDVAIGDIEMFLRSSNAL